MTIETQEQNGADLYKLMTAIIVPRPIGWVATQNTAGVDNLAPFSFFNMVAYDPPHVMFSPITVKNKKKDTLTNILETEEFVINLVTEDNVAQMNQTAVELPHGASEFEYADLETLPSLHVQPKRVKISPIHLECKKVFDYAIPGKNDGGATLIVGKVLAIHIDDTLMEEDFKINRNRYKPVGKLEGGWYTKTNEAFHILRKRTP